MAGIRAVSTSLLSGFLQQLSKSLLRRSQEDFARRFQFDSFWRR